MSGASVSSGGGDELSAGVLDGLWLSAGGGGADGAGSLWGGAGCAGGDGSPAAGPGAVASPPPRPAPALGAEGSPEDGGAGWLAFGGGAGPESCVVAAGGESAGAAAAVSARTGALWSKHHSKVA